MNETSGLKHAAPADQPTHVRQVAGRLFAAYQIDQGRVHLAGCTLEDRPFIRFVFRLGEQSAEVYVDEEGNLVDSQLVQSLGMTETIELERPPTLVEPDVQRLVECGRRLAEKRLPDAGQPELIETTVVWCKSVSGKLQFTVGERVAELPFAGWSRLLEPPPFVCPYTGRTTFHLAATDDGRITAADSIEACGETGRRLLRDDLETCSVTGRRARSELLVTCPVSGQRLLPSALVHCATCRQQVSPAALDRGECAACRDLQPVGKADPRVARLLEGHPSLNRWQDWRIAETAAVYVLAASGWFRRLLIVADKDSLQLRLLATRSRLSAAWKEVAPSEHESALQQ